MVALNWAIAAAMVDGPKAGLELYRAAAEKTTSVPERNYLTMRAARLCDTEGGSDAEAHTGQ